MQRNDPITAANGKQAIALLDIIEERNRQDDTFGEQNHHPAYWFSILGKQMGQLGEKVVDREWAARDRKSHALDVMRWEAVQVAAVALAMVEAIDRGHVPAGEVGVPQDPRQKARALGRDDESIHGREEYEGMGSEHELRGEPCG
jgi:hypothetical protein